MEYVEIQNTYNKEGFLIKSTANGVPMFIPKQDFPQVQVYMPAVEWMSEKVFMSPEQLKQKYPFLK